MTRESNGVINRKLIELRWILHIDMSDSRDTKIQGMETVPVRFLGDNPRVEPP